MAAEVLAAAGVAVTVYDRMPGVARKLILAGRGGLNLTNAEDLDPFLDRYGAARDRLAPALAAFGPNDLRAWCTGLGQDPIVGTSGRVFPAGFRALPLLRAWLARLDAAGVVLRPRHTWLGWDEGGALRFLDPAGRPVTVTADVTVLALGGGSWPRVGSDGRWVDALLAAGVEVEPLRPANCGFVVAWRPPFPERFAGVPLKDVVIGHRGATARGDAMITRTGIEGGVVYAVGAGVRDAINATGPTEVTVDLRPDLSVEALVERLARGRARDSAATRLRRVGLPPVAAGLLREVTGNQVPAAPEALAALIKAVPLRLEATQPLDRAISTAGGIRLREVDDRFMLVHRPGTFVAGEMLDWEAPTGGYLLQATFSTAVAAARGALAWLGP